MSGNVLPPNILRNLGVNVMWLFSDFWCCRGNGDYIDKSLITPQDNTCIRGTYFVSFCGGISDAQFASIVYYCRNMGDSCSSKVHHDTHYIVNTIYAACFLIKNGRITNSYLTTTLLKVSFFLFDMKVCQHMIVVSYTVL